MKDKGLENHQGVFLTVALGWGGLGAVSAIGSGLGHDVWLLMLPAGLCGLLLYFFYGAILNRAGGRGLAQMSLTAFGPRAGRAVLVLYAAYLLFITSYFLLAGLEIWLVADGQRAPFPVYIVLVLLLCALVARLGLAPLGRLALFLVGLYFVIAVIDTLFLVQDMDLQRILPLGVKDWPRFMEDAAYVSALLFCLLPLTLLILPQLHKAQAGRKCLGLGMALFFADLLLANLRNVFLFGDMLQHEDYPTYQALRLVEWGNGALRLELLGILATLAVVFMCGMVCLWGLNSLAVSAAGKQRPSLLWLLTGAAGLLMLFMKIRINFIDNKALLIFLAVSAMVILVLLFITLLKLQKSDCQKA